ncbi:MAG: Rne/Rng family ribonuclease [Solirubrobacterales bacterium]
MKKNILVSVDPGETRVAVLEAKGSPARLAKAKAPEGAKSGSGGKSAAKDKKTDNGWKPAELYVERRGRRSIVGNIYKGRVDNVLPGMEAAFVDIGLERNGFLHVDEIVLPGGEAAPKRGRGRGRRIDELISSGQEIVVQAVKDPLKTKGARLSMQLSIAGRYLVYMPEGDGIGVSKRLPDGERQRLRKLLDNVDFGKGGVIVRTAAHGAKKTDFVREVGYLHKLAEVVERRAKEAPAGSMVFQEADLSIRVLRDVLASEFESAVLDDEKQHQRVTGFLQRTAPDLVESVEFYKDKEPLFERWKIEEAFDSVLDRRVDLPSGGYLMIDYAEALTVVDINTGSFTGRGKGRLEDTITRVNVEAAEEVVRQLRMRDIGGIIVIDFIDMARAKNRDEVLKTLRGALDEDRTKSYVVEVSPLGLVEMTRQNVTDGVREILTHRCPTCDGEGVIESAETVAIRIVRRLRDVIAEQPGPEAYLIRVNPKVAAELIDPENGLAALEEEMGKQFHFEGGSALSLSTFEVVDTGSREEIEQRALPFQVGEEVLVKIEEPHMYNENDGVARVDTYVVSVAGGGRHIGEQRLVRIDTVERSTATASLLGDDGETLEEAEPEQLESANSSGRRRRGRRGGRGRARASASKD